jgi:hypothetical protein
MKTIDEYNLETLNKAISKGYTIKYIDHKTKLNRSYWYSVEIYNNGHLVSGFGGGEKTQAIQQAITHIDNISKNV